MTEFLVDIAKYQAGLSIAEVKKEGFAAVLARASTGYDGGSADPQFASFKSQATKAGILFGAYHFLYPASQVSVDHQAAVCAAAIDDTSIPVMIDHEPDGSSAPTPSISTAVNFAKAMRGKGYRVPLWYLPHWVWQDHLGSPALPTDAGLALVSSNYVSGTGYASELYPGAGGDGWDGYGGLAPVIWQFTNHAKVAGQLVDADAFKGSLAELAALLAGASPDPSHDPEDHVTRTSLSITQPTDAAWGSWTNLKWDQENTDPDDAHANGAYPGFISPRSAYVDVDVRLEVAGIAAGDRYQIRLANHTWSGGKSTAVAYEMLADEHAVDISQTLRAQGSLYLAKGHHLYVQLRLGATASAADAPTPQVTGGVWRLRQDG